MAARNIRLANEAWEALSRAQALLAHELTEADIWGDLLPLEYGVLHALSNAPHGLRISELRDDALLITQPGMSRLVIRLEARGLVERGDDPDDARASRIRLTPDGLAAQQRVGAAVARHVAETMNRALDPGDLAVLRDLSSGLLASARNERAAARAAQARGRTRKPAAQKKTHVPDEDADHVEKGNTP
ncbi:DNA-binding transcriptional regulator, MarR family [Actinacidiphila rubida]|uniref:DNA-binding transcriptional regulator, MarR family n=2 Tax=Actinacidiphila rubida TaxID=310780 RepID=A0A1H8LJK0_9ACTN|nr:MarR family transcriptional regulator [Actinacidiphila rubida]SEO05203.1 DNA-binding transcriptional regulator, MarR family [Actinacidiphila rubida]